MGISSFFSTYPGTHIVQAFFHSLTATVIVDRAIQTWDISDPLVRQRFRLIAILAPAFSYPLYQLINPERGSIYFRLDALFDSGRWLNLALWGKIPLSIFFVLLLAFTALIFLVQELIPILRHAAESKQSELEWDHPKEDSAVAMALEGLPLERSEIFIARDDDPVISSTTGDGAAVFLSTGLVDRLAPEELQAAIAHEVAHIRRSRRPLLIFTYLIRVLMFFNPATLVEFRRMTEDEEKICDDVAVELTRRPLALANALEALREGESGKVEGKNPSEMMWAIERMSHDILLQSRIRRLREGRAGTKESCWPRLTVTLVVILTINYFIV